jgi:hypothetical protein
LNLNFLKLIEFLKKINTFLKEHLKKFLIFHILHINSSINFRSPSKISFFLAKQRTLNCFCGTVEYELLNWKLVWIWYWISKCHYETSKMIMWFIDAKKFMKIEIWYEKRKKYEKMFIKFIFLLSLICKQSNSMKWRCAQENRREK